MPPFFSLILLMLVLLARLFSPALAGEEAGTPLPRAAGTAVPGSSAPAAWPAAPADPDKPRRLALVVGVGDFQDGELSSLDFAKSDAAHFRDWLINPKGGGFARADVKMLLNKQATRAGVKRVLENLAARTRPRDLVVVFVSTHGYFTQGEMVGIALYDSRSTGRWNRHGPILEDISALTRGDLHDFLSRLPARRRAIILDACHGAGVTPGLTFACPVDLGYDQKEGGGPDQGGGGATTFIVSSCVATEKAWESASLKSSIFTHYLLEGLDMYKGDLGQAFRHASSQTGRQAHREKGWPQTPRLFKNRAACRLSLAPEGE